jgi:hypothetical protein
MAKSPFESDVKFLGAEKIVTLTPAPSGRTSIADEPESLRDLSSDRVAIHPRPVLSKTRAHPIAFKTVNDSVTHG